MSRGWTYAKAGVDIDEKSRAIDSLVNELRFRRKGRGKMVEARGQFTSLIDLGDMYLTLCTDGVGTKILIAEAMNKWDTVGIDCIAMNVNDTICVGSEPMAFVDYIAVEHPDERIMGEIGKGLNEGAKRANMDVVGGEVAVMPEVVRGVDISGTCLGSMPKERLVSGENIEAGDIIIGLPSSGIHSNGLTLARRVMDDSDIKLNDRVKGLSRPLGEELLEPTRIYVREIMGLIEFVRVKGMVNITGGGLRNFLRLKMGVRFQIDDPLPIPPIFEWLADAGEIDSGEMYQTFNMGMGFALICSPEDVDGALDSLGAEARAVGRVTRGKGVGLGDEIDYQVY